MLFLRLLFKQSIVSLSRNTTMAIAWSVFFLLLLVFGLLFSGRVILFKTGLIYAVKKWWRIIDQFFHVCQLFKVPEFNESMQENQLYRKVYVYLNSLASIEDSNYTNLFTGKKSNDIILRLDPNQIIDDNFLGSRVSWINDEDGDIRTFVLKIRKADKRRILRPYLQHIHTVSDELEERNKDLKLYMNTDSGDSWRKRRWMSVPFKHPATFDTIAMESDLKNRVKGDLESFAKAKQYYQRLGRVWKRSYLLYGPSGTGKSSFVAAMANFLGYDVYDIDLSKVRDDSDLKMILLQTTTKSVVVIEDLDRFLMEKSTTLSLSGILNFMDGLLNSCCAEERLMVVTMNNKEQIDPAILRPGRIDVHIHFPVCDFSAFKNLASSYLGLKDHKLFPQVEEVFSNNPNLSAAEIGELMMANRDSPSRALKTVINALQSDIGRRLSENLARKSTEECDDQSGIFCGEGGHTMKELRKFVGLIRMKSGRKSQSYDLASPQR